MQTKIRGWQKIKDEKGLTKIGSRKNVEWMDQSSDGNEIDAGLWIFIFAHGNVLDIDGDDWIRLCLYIR